jgi:hypothetical protein
MATTVGTAAAGGTLDLEIDRFEAFSAALVRLEPCARAEVRRRVERFVGEVRAHLVAAPQLPARWAASSSGELLAAEHRRFVTSIAELEALLTVVEGEDHGGHRQALGQYGRIFAEALRRHRVDERGAGVPPRAGQP